METIRNEKGFFWYSEDYHSQNYYHIYPCPNLIKEKNKQGSLLERIFLKPYNYYCSTPSKNKIKISHKNPCIRKYCQPKTISAFSKEEIIRNMYISCPYYLKEEPLER